MDTTKLRILLTNDDGFNAEGLQVIYAELKTKADVTITAPDRERSAVSHGITMHHPLRAIPVTIETENHWMVNGTPADCVKLAVERLLSVPPDLVISGINRGPNLGNDVLYSGTVSAASEGAINHIPSIAVSLAEFGKADFNPAAQFVAQNLNHLAKLAHHAVLNLNFPTQYKGVKLTRLGELRYENVFDERVDPRGQTYYWMGGQPVHSVQLNDTDIQAVADGYVSITPLHFDLTDHQFLNDRTLCDLCMSGIQQPK